jgi:hypothetical protein
LRFLTGGTRALDQHNVGRSNSELVDALLQSKYEIGCDPKLSFLKFLATHIYYACVKMHKEDPKWAVPVRR